MTLFRVLVIAIIAAGVTVIAQFALAGHVNVFAAPLGAAAGVLAGAFVRR